MKKFKLLNKPTRISDLSFDDMADGSDTNWQLKAERMQARRWRKLKHQMI